nr:hypothetical protein BaRGS_009340 [Batillaria attramentaria]
MRFKTQKIKKTTEFSYTATYPDEPPLMEIVSAENLDDDQQAMILKFMSEQAEENLGMVMVFTIVSALQERLTVLVEETKREAEERRIQKQKEEEEAAQKKFEGTRVTIETFLAWKAKFDAERMDLKRLQKEEDLSKKPTGKELFEKDESLFENDINFLQDEGDNVEVDESLFEDMEDLDLDDVDDDDDDDDPDYVPGSK